MRKILSLLLALILILSVMTGCNEGATKSNGVPAADSQSGAETPNEDMGPGTNQEAQTATAHSQGTVAVCAGYDAYIQARDAFDEYTRKQSEAHEIVGPQYGMVCAFELPILEYLLPLSFIGQSVTTLGHYDEAMENGMLQTGWAEDAKLTDHGDGSFSLTGTATDGSALSLYVEYDPVQDNLRLEAQKDGETALLFEYAKKAGGYVAQYYFMAKTGYDFTGGGGAVKQMCVYKTIFDGQNGSCARFDGVDTEPDTLLGGLPSEEDFINGATHWFTIHQGKFTGRLNEATF